MEENRKFFYLGIFLALAYFAQYAFGLDWRWLRELQGNSVYKICTGALLMAFVLEQWSLSILRAAGRVKEAKPMYRIHNLLGVFAPLLFYVHSTTLGYGYQKILGISFFAVAISGIFNQRFLDIRDRTFSFFWMLLHVIPSVLIIILMVYHIYVVSYYQ